MAKPSYHLPKIQHRKIGNCQSCGEKTILLRTIHTIPFRYSNPIFWYCEDCRPTILTRWKQQNDKIRLKGRRHYNPIRDLK